MRRMAEIEYEWQRTAARIEADIAKLEAGAMIMGEREMAAEYGVAISTVRRAVKDLRERGLLVTLPHRGTFVARSLAGCTAQHPIGPRRIRLASPGMTDVPPPRQLPGGIDYVYARLADDIAERIRSGEFLPGTRLPGRGPLAAEYGVAELTVRRAVRELEGRGLVLRAGAKGALVIGHIEGT